MTLLVWAGLIQSARGLKGERLKSPEEEEILLCDSSCNINFSWDSSLPSYSIKVRIALANSLK